MTQKPPPLFEPALSEHVFARQVDWNLFRDFLAITRHGGVGAAARATGRQQPSLSAALKRLEDHLGQSLAVRGAQGITLTPAGKAVAELAQGIFGHVLSMPHRAAEAAGQLEGLVSIRMMSDIVAPALDLAMAEFRARYPKVKLRLDVAPWRRVVEAIATAESDIGIACDSAPREDLHYVVIASETQQLYCPRDSDLFGTTPHAPAELGSRTFVLTGEDEPDELAKFRRRHGLGIHVGGGADTLHEVVRLIGLGFGLGFLPTVVAAPHVQTGRLWPLLPETLLPSYPVHMITRAGLAAGSPASLLAQMIARLNS